jgi:predicted Zn-dependent peptidase
VARVAPAAEQRPGTTRTLLSAASGGLVRRTVLPGGARVITEAMPTVRSASFGAWVGTGSRDESPAQAGATHFLEHLLFKGTATRSALDISASLEAVGGDMNAFTSKEVTCFYARLLDQDLPLAIDVITDMMTSSTVSAADVDGERTVVLEEMAMRDDDPTDLVHDEFASAMFGDTPIGRPIIGTQESIGGMPRRVVHGFYRRKYVPPNVVFAAAGNVDHATVVRQVRRALAGTGWLDGDQAPLGPRPVRRAPAALSQVRLVRRDTEQANVVLGVPGLARDDERRHALGVLNAVLGGGMSSRLFQEVREKRGLAYSVFSYHQQFADTGMFGIYAGCPPHRVHDVLELCREQLASVATHGITDEELHRGKGQLRGGTVLSLEDSMSRMSRIGKGELVHGEVLSIDEVLRRIEVVTADQIQALASELVSSAAALAVVGPFDDATAFDPFLKEVA